ncbi:MAG: MarR family transcriptional regulator [Cytophagales bacterium]|nr:MarR family transcriptional regulator [Bernardetiaceae bacterium]MDW8211299.1 MarR family transcriptional regulator [Cytophagales bacterium]
MARIEEEIYGRFQSEEHKASVNLVYTGNWINSTLDNLLKKYDLTSQQYNMLRILRGAYPEPVSLKYVRMRMLDKMSDVSRMADKLFRKGCIDRWQSTYDRRIVNIRINQQGLVLLQQADKEVALIESCFTVLNTEELKQLNHLLDKLRTEGNKHLLLELSKTMKAT